MIFSAAEAPTGLTCGSSNRRQQLGLELMIQVLDRGGNGKVLYLRLVVT